MIVFDTETTGLIKNIAMPLRDQPQIVELCAIKLDDKTLEQVGEFNSLFYAKEMPEEPSKITGITTEMLVDAPRFADKADELTEFFLGERFMVGQNIAFDRDMLAIELRRMDMLIKFPWPQRHICTVEVTESQLGYRLGLSALHQHLFGTGFPESHRAKADTEATVRCVREIINRGMVEL